MLRTVSTLIVASWLFSSQPAAQQPPQPPPQPPTPQLPVAQQPNPQPPPAQPPPQLGTPSVDPDRKTALVLLGRIETLVEDALQSDSDKSDKFDRDKSDKNKSDKADKDKNKAVGTSGAAEIKPGSLEAKSGRVTVDRAMLDEILSEVAQVKMMLQR